MRAIVSSGYVAAVLALIGTNACGAWDAPDQNGAAVQTLTSGTPDVPTVAVATQGLFVGLRNNATFENVRQLGMFGREGLDLDPSNPQFVTLTFQTGGDLNYAWVPSYQNDKQANLVLAALNRVTGMSDQEKEASRGFITTVKAIDLLYVIQTSDQAGAILDVPDDPTAPPPPIVSKTDTYARIVQLLDQAATHLNNGGNQFAFRIPAASADFNTPQTFLKFNRGIKARVDVYMSNYTQALTDLASSFLDTNQPLTYGAYHGFSSTSGDAANSMYDPNLRQLFAHNSLATDAQLRADGTPDLRFTSKIRPVAQFTRYGFDVRWGFQIYNSPSAPIPIQKNEELILLRAEANIGLGDAAAALPDINFIRVTSGGLQAIGQAAWAGMSADAQLEELLYQKRYSLLWEGGFRWIDLRHYGKLAQLPKDQPGFVIFPYTRLPILECNPRNPAPPGCTQPAGL